jgi:hypothetical protein
LEVADNKDPNEPTCFDPKLPLNKGHETWSLRVKLARDILRH